HAYRQYQRLEHRPRLGGYAPPAVANSYHDEYRIEVWPGALASGMRFALDTGRRAVSGRRAAGCGTPLTITPIEQRRDPMFQKFAKTLAISLPLLCLASTLACGPRLGEAPQGEAPAPLAVRGL